MLRFILYSVIHHKNPYFTNNNIRICCFFCIPETDVSHPVRKVIHDQQISAPAGISLSGTISE